MEKDDVIISGFENEGGSEELFAVDFARAKRLSRSGSTCDVYEAMIQRRRVFIKRLKAEFRNNPLYHAAFQKEYELGVSLSHPSLPRYSGFGADYIVMDYIEGDTLADLIRRGDKRLRDNSFIRRLLGQLIDTVEYLHYRNIIHCDIKPDNIIISHHPDRPATLIDFDKAYSPWLDSTHGNAAKYDCEGCADGAIDFIGISKIADTLGYRPVAAAGRRKDASADTMRKALSPRIVPSPIWMIGAAVILSIVAAFIWNAERHTTDNKQLPQLATPHQHPERSPLIEAADTTAAASEPPQTPALAKESRRETHPSVDEIVKQYYSTLSRRHEYLRALAGDSTTSARQLHTAIASYATEQEKAQTEIISEVMERYGLTNPLEAHSILGTSQEWTRFMKQDHEISRLYSREIARREGVSQ